MHLKDGFDESAVARHLVFAPHDTFTVAPHNQEVLARHLVVARQGDVARLVATHHVAALIDGEHLAARVQVVGDQDTHQLAAVGRILVAVDGANLGAAFVEGLLHGVGACFVHELRGLIVAFKTSFHSGLLILVENFR